MPDTVVIGGAVAQKPGYGGHTWVFLQYLLGFRRLGFDVLLLDRLSPDLCRDRTGRACSVEQSWNLQYLLDVVHRFGLEDDFCLMDDAGGTIAGQPRATVRDRVASSIVLLNVMGFIDDAQLLDVAPRAVFLDIDPGLGQIWRELDLHDPFAGHDAFVTIGENIGRAGCTVPTCGLPWITSPQPVVLDAWPFVVAEGATITSVGSWRGTNGVLEYAGRTYGHRVHEFRRFIALPRLTARRFEMALAIDPADEADLQRLREGGWHVTDPGSVAADPDAYCRYIQNSAAEFMVAKNIYVQSRSGWFSDRSICYLASGRPVIAQDTGIGDLYPTGEGLLTFSTLDEAHSAVEDVCGDYPRHARAARAIAEEHFDSDRVLSRLLSELGAG